MRRIIYMMIAMLMAMTSFAQEKDEEPFMVSVKPNDISNVINDSCNVEFPVYDIENDSLENLIYQKIEKTISSEYGPISHIFLNYFYVDEECFQVGIESYTYSAALVSSNDFGVTFIHDVPVFIRGKDAKSILKLKEEKAFFKPKPYRGVLFCSPTEIYQYTFSSKEFVYLYKVMR